MEYTLSEEERELLLKQIPDFPRNSLKNDFPRNRIIYGAPGTGKSHLLKLECEDNFPSESLYKRVTFYPNYSYANFVGSYKPVPVYKQTTEKYFSSDKVTELKEMKEPIISYEFVPGPFLIQFVNAIRNPESNFLLIIEEINRANAPGVFGDILQLLDRTSLGESMYGITFNDDIMLYLKMCGIAEKQIKLPGNLYIWATMNNADQGVQPLDAAFKRRWTFEYLPLNKYENQVEGKEIKLLFLDNLIKWNKFRCVINDKLINLKVGEDKLLGPFFLKDYELADQNCFINKVLLYLKEDVLRHKSGLFNKSTFSEIYLDYINEKINIFDFPKEEFEI